MYQDRSYCQHPGGKEDARGAVCYTDDVQGPRIRYPGPIQPTSGDLTLTRSFQNSQKTEYSRRSRAEPSRKKPESYYKRSDEGPGQKMELTGTCPKRARAPPGAPSPVKLRQTYSRDAFRRLTKPKYRKRY